VVPLNIKSKCGVQNYHAVGNKYYCAVANDIVIDSPEQALIETLTTSHTSGKSDDDEIYFHISTKSIQYFPRGMEKFYKNLIGIVIWHTQLKEIHQDDLKPYPKLNNLYLSGNDIEFLEEGLFDFNPHLETIVFENTKLFYISSTVFDKLTKLNTLYLAGNKCTGETSFQDRTATLKIINSVKTSCASDFVNLNRKLENLEKISKNLNFANAQIFSQNLINFQTEFSESKMANFPILKQKLQKLMEIKINSPYEDTLNNLGDALNGFVTATNSYSMMDEKLTNINQKLSIMKQKMEQDLQDTQQNMLKAMDSKIEDLESRLTRKIEEILDQKLEKVMTNIRKIVTVL